MNMQVQNKEMNPGNKLNRIMKLINYFKKRSKESCISAEEVHEKKTAQDTCEACKVIGAMIAEKRIKEIVLQELVDMGELSLFAANCQPKDFGYWIEKGNHYTINACLKCSRCNKYYYVGFCLYGSPIMKEVAEADAYERAARLEWGYLGGYYEERKQ